MSGLTVRQARALAAFCAGAIVAAVPAVATPRIATVAMFPVENLTGRVVPSDEIHGFLSKRLGAAGVTVLSDAALDDFMTRHRVRYAAGIDTATAGALKGETHADAVVIVSVDLYSGLVPPKVALFARLVSLDAPPAVIWADDAALSGDDAPGLLDLGLVDNAATLLTRALDRVTGSLLSYIDGGRPPAARTAAAKFKPKIAFNGVSLEYGKVYSIAVLPFFNVSDRANAGEILACAFIRHFSSRDAFRVADTGDVREQLLKARIIMDGGVALSDAELVGSLLDADFVLAGRVLYYEDYEGAEANPRVEFSTVLIERRSRRVVWSSQSYNAGGDGVRFFGRGRSTTAHAMATQMAGLAADRIAAGRRGGS